MGELSEVVGLLERLDSISKRARSLFEEGGCLRDEREALEAVREEAESGNPIRISGGGGTVDVHNPEALRIVSVAEADQLKEEKQWLAKVRELLRLVEGE